MPDRTNNESYFIESDPLLKSDYEGPKVLVSFVFATWDSPSTDFSKFENVILNTCLPRTNKDLDIIKMAAANYSLGRMHYKYDNYDKEKARGNLPKMFIFDIKEV